MKLGTINKTNESLNSDNDDHEYRGEFTSAQSEDTAMDDSAVEAVNSITESDAEYKDIDDIDTGIGEAVDAVSQINDLAEVVNSQEGTSLSPLEEQAIQETMESIFRTIGIVYTTPTLESATGYKRRTELVATMESKFQTILNSLVTAIKQTAERVLAFLMNLLRNNFILLKYLKNTEAKVKAITQPRPSVSKMTDSAKPMSANGVADYDCVELFRTTAERMLEMTDSAIDKIKDLNFKFGEQNRSIDSSISLERNLMPHKGMRNGYGYLPGDRGFTDYNVGDKIFGVSRVYKSVESGGKLAQQADVLTKDQMLSALRSAEGIINGIKRVDSKKSIIKNFISRVSQFVTELGAGYAGIVSKAAREAEDNLRAIRGVRNYLNSIIGRFPLEAFKIAKALIDYARHSAKNYGVGDAGDMNRLNG